jgi:hypothetical protein
MYLRKMGTDLLFSSNMPTRGDYLGYKSIKIESILSIQIDKYRRKSIIIDKIGYNFFVTIDWSSIDQCQSISIK